MAPDGGGRGGPPWRDGPGPPWGSGPPPWLRGGGPPRFVRRVALLAVLLLVLVAAAGALAVTAVESALGHGPGAAAVAAGVAMLAVLVVGLVLVARAVRRLAAPIGDVMAAADRVADGDLAARVEVRGPREVRRLGRRFNEMTARLEASDAERRRLVADVTHELRTPLSVIRGNVEGVLDGLYAADAERLETILEETRTMARLLDDLGTLSTAQAGALRLEREPTDLAALAADVAAAFAPRAAAGAVALTTAAEPLPAVAVDPVRIRQVLENLVANALRHTPPGGRVEITLVRSGEDVELAVADTGPGIPPDRLATVFERYARSADSGGSGLGLAIARSLVEAHGGTIRAESPPGGGTALRLRLPLDA